MVGFGSSERSLRAKLVSRPSITSRLCLPRCVRHSESLFTLGAEPVSSSCYPRRDLNQESQLQIPVGITGYVSDL